MIDLGLKFMIPELLTAAGALLLLLYGALHRAAPVSRIIGVAMLVLTVAAIVAAGMPGQTGTAMGGMLSSELFSAFVKTLICGGLVLSLALAAHFLPQEDMARFEYPVLVMLAGVGMMLMVSAQNFLALYMGLELQSLSLYVLAAFRRDSIRAAEAGVKYFALGAISSGMILFGISLIYGFTGSLDYSIVQGILLPLEAMPYGIMFALVFVLAGLAFKVSAVPFHMWTPDVYQGAPTAVTALFAMVPKIAALAVILRLLCGPFAALDSDAGQIIWFLAASSMVWGAFAGVAQNNIKRLMAYSSIGNMGYALVGLATGEQFGAGALLFYLVIYMVMTAGVFTVILSLRRGGRAAEEISDFAGLSASRPALAYCMALLMFSMAGIPPLAGFFGKLAIFQSAVADGLYVLAVLGVLTSVVSAYYYLRIIKVMFFDAPGDVPLDTVPLPVLRRIVLGASILFLVLLIIRPSALLIAAQDAAVTLFS